MLGCETLEFLLTILALLVGQGSETFVDRVSKSSLTTIILSTSEADSTGPGSAPNQTLAFNQSRRCP